MPPALPNDEKTRDRIAHEAANWCARLAIGTADPAAFERWRAESPAHAVAVARVTAAWETVDAVPDVVAAAPASPSRRTLLRTAGLVAAGGLAASFVAVRAAAWPRAETAIGERRIVALGRDGRAMLNTDSELAWHETDQGLRLRLERGEVALQLNGRQPATLKAGDCESILSAGRFCARLERDGLEVAVLGGSARMVGTGGPKTALSRQILRIGPDGGTTLRADDRIERALAWQGGEILFQDEPLAEAIADYNRYLTRKIVIVDPALADIRIGGRFTTSDPEPFLRGLRDGFGVSVSERDDGILLAQK
ncbi:DUF4880 domain-containing protein [Sphingomonas sp. AP4-R1]|uniref:FecR family protein n=1 Tax=Sphingomonas sp. AP4-R1 TaxID=2735134 RepID=UPI0014935F2E|nr:DUF4880 domain-containing protein [Sphingomonas sp. AP4-R1]QJU60155.1 DUF4880 domain-containing protein [Sphingomonas sp. AP4-R1]